jgi:rhodanese-related sulfurtransferase
MTTPPDADGARRGPPRWFLPALVGGMIAIAGLVAVLLTRTPPPVQAPAAQQPALPSAEAQPAPEAQAEPGTEAHGGLNPEGPAVEQIGLDEARALFDAGTAIFIDVRAGSDYGAGHIPGALTITSQELEGRLSNLPEGAVLIAYGDAARPESGQRGAQIFMEMGYPTMLALEGGFQAWRDAGHPVETVSQEG